MYSDVVMEKASGIEPENDFGIYLSTSRNNTFSGNIITDNLFNGVYLTFSELNEFTLNEVTDHSGVGINVTNSNNNSFE